MTMDERFRRDLHAALDPTCGSPPSSARLMGALAGVRPRSHLYAARPWLVGVGTALVLAAILAAPRIIGPSRPIHATPPSANQPTPSVPAGVAQAEASPTAVAPAPVQLPSQIPSTSAATLVPIPSATPMPPVCTSADVQTTVTTDRDTYAQGETIAITVAKRNVSGHPCSLPSGGVEREQVLDSAGNYLWGMFIHYDGPPNSYTTWEPGRTFTAQESWNQYGCSRPGWNGTSQCQFAQVPAGTYTVVGDLGYGPAQRRVTITAKPTPSAQPSATPGGPTVPPIP